MHPSRQIWRNKPDLAEAPQTVASTIGAMSLNENVLDHGFITVASEIPRQADRQICHAARVLPPWSEPWRGEADVKLLEHMLRNGHTTPFEHISVSFYIRAPIMVFRQWHRHRTQAYNEMSARYRPLPGVWYTPEPNKVGTQSAKNHQARDLASDSDDAKARLIAGKLYDNNARNYVTYEELLELGCPRELARGSLSVFMYSEMYATANLHNWLRFLMLRDDAHAQYEIQVYAKAMLWMLRSIAPVTLEIYDTIRSEEARKERIYDLWCAGKLKEVEEYSDE